jgi:hypothetical protein
MNDYSYDNYLKRQLFEITPDFIRENLATIKKANNFEWVEIDWKPNRYEGFGVITMLGDHPQNEMLSSRLQEIQKEFDLKLASKDRNIRSKYFQLPAASYHQTVANLLSNERFQQNIVDRDLLDDFPNIAKEAFEGCDEEEYFQPIAMNMIGLSVFGTCVAMLGTFVHEGDYQRITDIRESIYNQDILADLDIKMTRPFIGHITLTYFEADFNDSEKENLGTVINEINQKLGEEENIFYLNSTSLRRFHHLAEFLTEKNYPKILI